MFSWREGKSVVPMCFFWAVTDDTGKWSSFFAGVVTGDKGAMG